MAGSAYQIDISGIVQGVGFRPFIFRLAKRYNLNGYVSNTSIGVHILIEGEQDSVMGFLDSIEIEKPVISYIYKMDVVRIKGTGAKDFAIRKSEKSNENSVFVSYDLSTCKDCRKDVFDHNNRRFHYPFTTCTYCGPRYSIIRDIPYDRDNTVMDEFEMCQECQREYEDPYDRRYHSQPNACEECGPKLSIYDTKEKIYPDIRQEDQISFISRALKNGKIVAIKGLGGYQLCCDAYNNVAVKELRKRKQREQKPFALMCRDLAAVKTLCHILPGEEEILLDQSNPIVLLKKRNGDTVAEEVSIDNDQLGVMLPYTPFHHMLMEETGSLVMTSANISDMPIISDNDEARERLSDISDYIMMHNRKIHRRVDDSVFKVINARPQAIRRARGYTPGVLKAKGLKTTILAVGGELKNTFALNRGENIFVSPHIGDLKNAETFDLFKDSVTGYINLFGSYPATAACDMHPGYLSTIWAEENFENVIKVQHHHAHLASVLLENGIMNEQAIGISMDGTGYGTDGAVWGCECGIVSFKGFSRRGHLNYFKLPGGDKCAAEIFRCAISLIYQTFGWIDASRYVFLKELDAQQLKLFKSMIDQNIYSIPTSSMGRLFDGISCILGLGGYSYYEASAAIRLENIADIANEEKYPVVLKEKDGVYLWFWEDLIAGLLKDLDEKTSITTISSKFHNSVVDYIIKMAEILRKETGLNKVALSGGVFNNSIISSKAENYLRNKGFDVFLQRIFPAGDGGICIGQMIIASEVI